MCCYGQRSWTDRKHISCQIANVLGWAAMFDYNIMGWGWHVETIMGLNGFYIGVGLVTPARSHPQITGVGNDYSAITSIRYPNISWWWAMMKLCTHLCGYWMALFWNLPSDWWRKYCKQVFMGCALTHGCRIQQEDGKHTTRFGESHIVFNRIQVADL